MSATSAAPTRGPVVVGVDASDNAQHALGIASQLAVGLGVELLAVHALGLMTVIDGEHVSSEGRQDEVAELTRRRWCTALDDVADLGWDVRVVYGSPPDVLLDVADDVDAAMIVVGSRADRPELALGSTSTHVVHHADRPVVVVPPADRRRLPAR